MVTIEDARALVSNAVRADGELLRSREWPLVQVNHLRKERQYPPFQLTEDFCKAAAMVVNADCEPEECEDILSEFIASKRVRGCIIFVPGDHPDRLVARRLLAEVGDEIMAVGYSSSDQEEKAVTNG